MNSHDDMLLRMCLSRADFHLSMDLVLPGSGITVLFGVSGSGKTTVLRCVAGLERAQRARVRVGETVWQDDAQGLFVPTWKRDVGYVFQEASLFDHLTVQENLHFGLKRSGKTGGQKTLDNCIALLGIGHLLQRQPASLSGGERQRVAIARALATQPKLLLLDEPLASLDTARRHEILPWLENLRNELNLPMLYVTHAADEVVRLADHLVVLEQGHVKAQGRAQDVLTEIDSPVMVGEDVGVVLNGTVEALDSQWHLAKVVFEGGCMWVRDSRMTVGKAVRLRVLARDVSITLQQPSDTSIQNHLPARIDRITSDAHPSQALIRLHCGTSVLLARVTQRAVACLHLSAGLPVWVQVKSVAVVE